MRWFEAKSMTQNSHHHHAQPEGDLSIIHDPHSIEILTFAEHFYRMHPWPESPGC